MPKPSGKKYRPVFSATEITYLSRILKRAYMDDLGKQPYHHNLPDDINRSCDPVQHDYMIQLMAKVSTLESKIANDAIQPAYVDKPTKIVMQLQDLGAPPELVAAARTTQTKEEFWEECYNATLIDPTGCTVPEMEAAQEHKYLNDLMTPSEVKAFEAKLTNGVQS